MSTDHSAPNANPETNRPTPNYHPSIWGNRFIMTNTPDDEGDFVISITLAHEEQQLEDLKQEVRRELIAAASNLSQQLKFIDAVQRLGCIQQEKGRFKESVMINDACGQLGLYEAVHISGYPLAAQETHALDQPIRKGLERLEARPFMHVYLPR
ncbi:Valencene synthase [Vitis vinifera]|uniref:Valencene synthase n=1 Tax=Vitis vinifera TaxID=29760 RepID=A0A438CAL7_VITVI|nr:Valencene synthase [Vitis vinifera]RVW86253.1 Valencene synthase [Vitis vinifera]